MSNTWPLMRMALQSGMFRLGLTLFFLVLLFSSPLQARLGESEAAVVARYGEPRSARRFDPNLTELTFISDGWSIRARFLAGVCQYITYTKNLLKSGFDEAQTKLLEANGYGLGWLPKKVAGVKFEAPTPMWVRNDRLAYAYIPKSTYFNAEFFTTDWVNYGKGVPQAKSAPGALPNF